MRKTLKLINLMLLSSMLLFSCKGNEESSTIFPSESINDSSTTIVDSSSNVESSSILDIPSSEDSSSTIIDSSSNDASSSNEEISSNESHEDTSSTTPEPSYITLNTPLLSLNEDTGVVTFDAVENASFYWYYINGGAYQSTTNNTIKLNSGETLVVCADNDDPYILTSTWSEPITYFEKEIVETEKVKVYFHDSSFSSIELEKGSTYVPSTPYKEGHTFENWYLDPFYQKVFDSTKKINKDTILYAHYIKDNCLDNVTYWIKADENITHPNQANYLGSSWKFIPLTLEENSSTRMFSATVTVSNTSTTDYGEFIVMDGIDSSAGRTYWKKGNENFNIKTDGTYKIYFSLEKEWLRDDGIYVHVYMEQLSTTFNGRKPVHSTEVKESLQIPVVTIDKANNLASWSIQDNATYAYQIDNKEVKYTTDNNTPIFEGSFITVKAISTDPYYIDSKWSTPYKYYVEYDNELEYCYVYFHDSNLPAMKVEKGSKITRPNNPTKSKYTFDNWYTNISKTTVFDFDLTIEKNTVIYSKWIPLIDYKTTIFYSLVKGDGSKVTDLSLYENNVTYNEYHASYTVNSSETLYVKRLEDGKLFGPYVMDEAGIYDIYFSEEHIWNVNTTSERNAYWAKQEITLYFTNSKYWSNVYYYTWDINGQWEHAWPGTKMSYVKTNSYGQDIYKLTLNANIYTQIIFNSGDGKQTIDIDISTAKNNDAYYVKDEKDSSGHYKVGTWTYA